MLPPFSEVSGSAPFSKDCVTLINLFPKVDQGVHKSTLFQRFLEVFPFPRIVSH